MYKSKNKRNTEARRTRSKGSLSFRRGQGPDSTKKWTRELFKEWLSPGQRKRVNPMDTITEHEFTMESAERARRRLAVADEKIKPLMVTRKKKNSLEVNVTYSEPPQHIVRRAARANLWLAKFGKREEVQEA